MSDIEPVGAQPVAPEEAVIESSAVTPTITPAGAAPPLDEKPRLSWFGTLVRLWLLQPVAGGPRGSPFPTIILLSLSWLAAWIRIDKWQRQPAPEFTVEGIPLLAWYALGVVVLAGALTWKSRPRAAFPAMLVLALGVIPLPLLLVSVAPYFVPAPWIWWAGGAVIVYLCVFLLRGMRSLTGRSQTAPALVGVLFIVAFMWASDVVDAIPDLWTPRESIASLAEPEDGLAERESVLFEQVDKIDEALETIHRGSSPDPQAFFLGFAGVGGQKEFAQEIGLASRVLGERYHVGDRQLSLVNDERDLEGAPLASVTGLNYALQGLAGRMNLDKDVLFLSISSHGSEAPSIAVANSQFPLTSLRMEDLKEALRESGIQWRVIIISACYAGGFVDALRDPKTIVIAAAAKDRMSFGCSNDADLTYFGEAFYRDALPEAKSLRAAFEAAKAAIAERERREHEMPSDPQAYFGGEIEAKLSALEQIAI